MASQKKTQDRSSRFIWTEQDIVIIRKGDGKPPTDTQAGQADHGDVAPAATPEEVADEAEQKDKP